MSGLIAESSKPEILKSAERSVTNLEYQKSRWWLNSVSRKVSGTLEAALEHGEYEPLEELQTTLPGRQSSITC